ncbi:MAG: hypothetical protein NT080_07735 [Spirochaetes bacterium]|nr:hypothetical protein [Spirochaetota bacterium]
MSTEIIDPKVATRRLFVRSGLVAVYFLLLVVTFLLGKGYTLLIDNKDAADGSVVAIDGVLVSVDGAEALELYSGDRDATQLKGQRHRVIVELISDGKKIEKSIHLPLDTDMLLLSVPKLVAGIEPFVEVFVLRDQPRPAGEEVGNTNAFTSPDSEALETVEPPVP